MRKVNMAVVLLALALLPLCRATETFDPMERAARHPITLDKPAVDFFQGALLGNGAMGVVVCTRPDSVVFHFGHNSVWDIRAEEIPMSKLGTFEELWQKFQRGERDWVVPYNTAAQKSVRKPYPRPWPCGSLLLGFDRRDAELLGHTLHIEQGRCDIRFLVAGQVHTLEVFMDMAGDRLWMRMVGRDAKGIAAPFLRAVLASTEGMPTVVQNDARTLSFRQTLAGLTANPNKDRAIRVSCRTSRQLLESPPKPPESLPPAASIFPSVPENVWPKKPYQLPPSNLAGTEPFIGCVELLQGLAKDVPDSLAGLPEPTAANYQATAKASVTTWAAYWRRSGVALDDAVLERTWYRNQYFMNCVSRPGTQCPGLFGNWMTDKIGTAWHGEYVFDYNIEQPWWGTFSSNRPEQHLPYVDLIHQLQPNTQSWAKNFYGLRGAFFAQIHWPVETPAIPVPWFGWGNHLAPVSWAVQSLWWHYAYTQDQSFLRERAFGPIKQATLFMNAYMRRPDAHGPRSPWKDAKFHIHPTQSPEMWPDHFGDPQFSDDIASLALTKFLFRSYLQACRELDIAQSETDLMKEVTEILANMPDYPTAESPRGGRVFMDVAGASPDAIYNTPNPLMPVFPGEELGLHSPPELFKIAANTWRNQQNEGGNDLVMIPLQGARLGLLDLEKFKRQINYCLLDNGSCTDMVLQSGGRYSDDRPRDFMARMGIWVENFALPAVINECLLQSYTGELRMFPNWSAAQGTAKFQDLRAVGAFLVSAEYRAGKVQWVRISAETNRQLRAINPWPGKAAIRRHTGPQVLADRVLVLTMQKGETITLHESGTD